MVDSVNPTPPPNPISTPSSSSKPAPGPAGQPTQKTAHDGYLTFVDQLAPNASQEDKQKFSDAIMKTVVQFMNTQAAHHKEIIDQEKEDDDSIIG